MSLLIKALDSAEKNKQAELNKKKTGERVADVVLPLELAPVEVKQTAESKQTTEENPLEKPEAMLKLEAGVNAFVDHGLSLEEEAGLTPRSLAANKYARSKPGADKAAALSGGLHEAAKPKGKAAAPAVASTLPLSSKPTHDSNQEAAAKVFVANQAAKTPSSKSALMLFGVIGALMILLGLQGYSYMRNLVEPVAVVKPAMRTLPLPQVAVTMPAENAVATPVELAALPQGRQVATPTEMALAQVPSSASNQTATNQAAVPNNDVLEKARTAFTADKTESKATVGAEPNRKTFVAEKEASKKSQAKKLNKSSDESFADSEAQSQNMAKHAPVRLISKAPSAGVDPTLLSAYQAFNRGEDAAAQQQYRQVLLHDVRNVDALLGMAAIAQRQGRDADAAGWYQKILEIEPRNTIALAAMISPQANVDAVGTESRIKSMLALQPEAANLHAALGNLYAEQNQWSSAQEAYFNASRFAPNNADYAFNLAISLDQLGKSSLALKQYQRALDLLSKSGASSPDRAQLEARIKALQ